MQNLLLTLMLASPLAAAQDDYSIKENLPKGKLKYEKYEYAPGTVELSGTVEVPLYSDFRGDPAPKLAVTLPESEAFHAFSVDLNSQGIWVTEGFAAAAGAKVKENQGGKVAVIPEMHIGELVLRDVNVRIGGNKLGLHAFSELAVALLPSEGVARFALAGAEGEALVAAVGEAVPYSSMGGTYFKYMREKQYLSTDAIVINGQVNGQDALVYLGGPSVMVDDDMVEGEPLTTFGLNRYYLSQVKVGDQALLLMAQGYNNPPYYPDFGGVTLDSSVTAGWDLAYDPASMTVAFKPAETLAYVSTWDIELAEALADLEAPAPAEGEEAAEAPDMSGAHKAVANLYLQNDMGTEALEHAEKVVEAKAESCSAHLLLGDAQFAAGKNKAAMASYQTAGELYSAWADKPLVERDALAEASEEDPSLADKIQTHSCHVAWGNQAEVALSMGDFDKALAVFDEHMDLDANLAMVAAQAYLAQERYDDALAAMYQARLINQNLDAQGALTLAVAQHASGNASALANYRYAADFGGLAEARAYASALVDLQGAEGALALKEGARVDANWSLALAEALDAGYQDSAKAWKDAVKAYEREQVLRAGDADFWAGYGIALLNAGDQAGAAEALKAGMELDASSAQVLMLAGDLAAAKGDYDKARKLYEKAAKGTPMVATYAGLLASK